MYQPGRALISSHNYLYICSGRGLPISSLVDLRGRGYHIATLVRELGERIVDSLNEVGYIATASNTIGFQCRRNISAGVVSPEIVAHEDWHLHRFLRGFGGDDALGYKQLDESMAHVWGDIASRDRTVLEDRVSASKHLASIYHRIMHNANNGGQTPVDQEDMVQFIGLSHIGYYERNWAAFMHSVQSVAFYALCEDIIRSYGKKRARQIFMRAIYKIERSGSPEEGYNHLLKFQRDKDYTPTWIPTSRAPGTGSLGNLVFWLSHHHEDFLMGLWTSDSEVTEIVTTAFMEIVAEELDVLDEPIHEILDRSKKRDKPLARIELATLS